MIKFVLVIHLIIAAAMIGIVLLQKSEDDALGIADDDGSGFLTDRGTANLLTRLTAGLACLFFVTSLTLTILAGGAQRTPNLFNNTAPAANGQPAGKTDDSSGAAPAPGGLIDRIRKGQGTKPVPAVPQNQ